MNPNCRPRTTLSMPANLHCLPPSFTDSFSEAAFKRKSLLKTPKTPGKTRNVTQKDSKDPATFSNRYKKICHSMHIQPLNMVKVLLSNISLDITCDRIKLNDIMAILKTIEEDRSLHYICLKSRLKGIVVQEDIDTERKARESDKVLQTRFVVNSIAECLKENLTHSENLKALKIQSIPIAGRSVEILSEGLRKTDTLQHLSLELCAIGDEGCLLLCRALRLVPTILTLDLTSCKLTAEGARHITALIKGQEIARFEQGWKQSLRYREVNNEEMKGLRRITLNDNPDIGDEGFKYIFDVLLDDFWIRALDVQNCGISDDGAVLAMELIETNNEIGVVDLRRNPLINDDIITAIVKQISLHMNQEKAEYGWLCMAKSKRVFSDQSETGSTVSSCPWNSGPGMRKAKSITEMDPSARSSILKVKEWRTSKGNKIESTVAVPPKSNKEDEAIENNTSENQLNILNNTLHFEQNKLTPQSDESEEKLNVETSVEKVKSTEDIELLFCNFIMD